MAAQLRLEPGDVFPDLLGSLQKAVGLARVQIAQARVEVLEVVLKVLDVAVGGALRVLGGDGRGREGRDEGHHRKKDRLAHDSSSPGGHGNPRPLECKKNASRPVRVRWVVVGTDAARSSRDRAHRTAVSL